MCSKRLKNNMVRKILFITLSNIGDVVLSLPVLDALREKFPQASVTVVCGERAKGVFEGDPDVGGLIVYDKRSGIKGNIKLFISLWKERFDVVVDLRNSFFGVLLPAKYKTSPFIRFPQGLKHMKDKHLYKIKKILDGLNTGSTGRSFHFSRSTEEKIGKLLKEGAVGDNDRLVVIAAGSRSHTKRWPKEKFVELIKRVAKDFAVKIILTGDKDDAAVNQYIAQNTQALDLSGKISLNELSYILKKARVLITNDSAASHIASYLDVPLVAVFGITNDAQYGRWSRISTVV